MKNRLQGVVIGVVIGVMLVGMISFASTGGRNLWAEFSDIKILIEGSQITPTDANGNAVEPFIVEGTTYLPVRAVAEALGQNVAWDGDTKSVLIASKNSDNVAPAATPSPAPASTQTAGGIQLNHDYGPFKLISEYSTGTYWNTVTVHLLKFSKAETTSTGKYKVYMNVKGICDDASPQIVVKFYDADDMVLDEVSFYPEAQKGEEFNCLDTRYVEKDVVDNSVKIEFFSHTGKAAQYGASNVASGDNTNSTDADIRSLYDVTMDIFGGLNDMGSCSLTSIKSQTAMQLAWINYQDFAKNTKPHIEKAIALLDTGKFDDIQWEYEGVQTNWTSMRQVYNATLNAVNGVIRSGAPTYTDDVWEYTQARTECALAISRLSLDLSVMK